MRVDKYTFLMVGTKAMKMISKENSNSIVSFYWFPSFINVIDDKIYYYSQYIKVTVMAFHLVGGRNLTSIDATKSIYKPPLYFENCHMKLFLITQSYKKYYLLKYWSLWHINISIERRLWNRCRFICRCSWFSSSIFAFFLFIFSIFFLLLFFLKL